MADLSLSTLNTTDSNLQTQINAKLDAATGVAYDSAMLGGHLPAYYAPATHIGTVGSTQHGLVTADSNTSNNTTKAGFMGANDKDKLDKIASGAEVNQVAFTYFDIYNQTDATTFTSLGKITANSKTSTLRINGDTLIGFAVDTTNRILTIKHPTTHPATMIDTDATHRFVTDTQMANWDDKYTKNQVDNLMGSYANGLIWKTAVATYADIATTYPDPEDGWTVNVTETDTTYRYNLSTSTWVVVSASYTPLATETIDGKMSAADKTKLDNIQAYAEVNQNAYNNLKIGTTNILATSKTDTVEFVNGSNITLTADAANKKLTIAATGFNIFDEVKSDSTSILAAGISDTLTFSSGNLITLTPNTTSKSITVSTTAEINQNAYSNAKVGPITIPATGKMDTIEFIAGSNIILTPNTTNKTIKIDVDGTVSNADTLDSLHADDIVGQRIDKTDLTNPSWYLIGTLAAPSATANQKIYVEVQGSSYGTTAPNDLINIRVLFSNANTFNFLFDDSKYINNVIKVFAYKQADNTIKIYLNLTNAFKSSCIVKAASIGLSGQTVTSIKLTAPSTSVAAPSAVLFDSSTSAQNIYDFAYTNHGNHVPATQVTDNSTFLRNDNNWYSIQPHDVDAFSIFGDTIKPLADATSNILQVKNAAGSATIFNVDTTNKSVGINTASPSVALDTIGAIKASLDITAGNNIIANKQLISQIATGNAPIAVNSTTKVSNLNVDMIDDLHADDIIGQRIGIDSTSNAKYFLVGTLPAPGTYGKIAVDLIGGEESILMNMSAIFTNHDIFTYRYYRGKDNSAYISIVAYQQADNSVKIYVRINKPTTTANAVIKAYNVGITGQTTTSLKIDSAGTITIPVGTLVFDSSSPSFLPNAYGNGSLFDSDLLDGLHSGSFMRSDADTYSTGRLYITGGTGVAYSNGPLEIRVGGTSGNTTANCAIAFHRPGIVASQLGMDTNGVIRTYNNPGTGYEKFAALTLTSTATTTAPLVVSSQIMVDNLNTEMINGYYSADLITRNDVLNQVNVYRDVASYNNDTACTGTIKLTLPTSWTNTMLSFEIDGYDYSSKSYWKLLIGGYNYSGNNSWSYGNGSTLLGNAPFNQVRLAHDGTKCCILLGTTTTSWQDPKVIVSKVIAGYGSAYNTGWDKGWSTSLITSETGITSTVTLTNLNSGNAGTLSGYTASNNSGSIPIANGIVNTNLNADMVDGVHITNIGKLDASNSWTGPINTYTNDVQVNGKLYFKASSDNTDPMYITKNDVANDLSVLDIFIGDNGDLTAAKMLTYPAGGSYDYLAIRTTNGNTYHLFDGAGNYSAGNNVTANANIIAKSQLTSQVATGTAPLAVTSTTKVANLNVDMIDDLHADSFVLKYGYTTTNSSSTYLNQWTKVASTTITSQYSESEALIDLIGTGPSSSLTTRGRITFRVKQQNALGNAPIIDLMLSENINIDIANIKAVTTVNNSTTTTVALYIQSVNSYEAIVFTPIVTAGIAMTFYNNQGYVSALPVGAITDCIILPFMSEFKIGLTGNVVTINDKTHTYNGNHVLDTSDFSGTGSAATVARSDHNHTGTYDNYAHWNIKGGSADTGLAITSDATLILNGGTNVSVTRSGSTVTITSTDTNTATAANNILSGSNSGTTITYAPYTTQQSTLSFDTSTTNPTLATRLNLNGYLYATKLYSGAAEVEVKGHNHNLDNLLNVNTNGKLDKDYIIWDNATSKWIVKHGLGSTDISDFNEAAQDAVGSILLDTDSVNFTYDDVSPFIYADVKANSTVQKVEVRKNNVLINSRKTLNFIDGTNTTISIADDNTNDRINLTVNSSSNPVYNSVTAINDASVGGKVNIASKFSVQYNSSENSLDFVYIG